MIMVKHQTLRCSIFSEETWIPIAEYDDQPSNLGFSTMWNPKNNVKTVKIRGSSDNIKQPKGCSKELFCGFPKAHGQPLPQSLQIQNPTDHEAPRCHGRVWRWRNLTWRRGVDDDYSYHDDYIMFFSIFILLLYIKHVHICSLWYYHDDDDDDAAPFSRPSFDTLHGRKWEKSNKQLSISLQIKWNELRMKVFCVEGFQHK